LITGTNRSKLKKIKVVAMDVNGVLTDGGIVLGSKGMELKVFDVQDGMGITLARMGGLKTAIITGRESEAVKRRFLELKFDAVFQGAKRKREAFPRLLKNFNVSEQEVCYIGDDLLDLELIKMSGLGVDVLNARPEVKKAADFITNEYGGRGAVREVIEIILKAQKKWKTLVSRF